MKVTTLLLANGVEQPGNGLLYTLGAGWDTAYVPPGVAPQLAGAVIVRTSFDRSECQRLHQFEIRLEGEDGQLALRVVVPMTPVIPDDYPIGWEIPYTTVAQLGGNVLPRLGLYRITVLIDGAFAAAQPLRVLEAPAPAPGG